jgi:DNA-directed RNA polymerase specialized sigma24 family protein
MPANGLCDATVAITPTTPSEVINSNHDGILELLDTYILSLARQYVPRSCVPIVDLAISELAQNTRIKLWLALCREPLTNPRAYVRRVVLTECADMVQRYKPLRALPMNEDGELEQDHLRPSEEQQWHDPADEFEQQEAMIDCMHEAVETVLALSPRQQQAMLWALQSCDVDTRLLRKVFLERGLDIAAINTPDNAVELQRWRASLSAARKKTSFAPANHRLIL